MAPEGAEARLEGRAVADPELRLDLAGAVRHLPRIPAVPRYRLSGVRVRAPKAPDEALLARLLGVPPRPSPGSRSSAARSTRGRSPTSSTSTPSSSSSPRGRRADLEPPLWPSSPPRRGAPPSSSSRRSSGKARVAVVGTGPAGLFAALALADAGVSLVVLERGDAAEERYRRVMRFWKSGDFDPESNVQFGEGGAGTFSDGKLTCGKRHDKIAVVLETLHRFGAPDTILYDGKPHIGTDRLVVVLRNIRKHLLDRGAEMRYRAKVVDVLRDGEDGPLRALLLEAGEEVPCDAAIFALGHSARDTVERSSPGASRCRRRPSRWGCGSSTRRTTST